MDEPAPAPRRPRLTSANHGRGAGVPGSPAVACALLPPAEGPAGVRIPAPPPRAWRRRLDAFGRGLLYLLVQMGRCTTPLPQVPPTWPLRPRDLPPAPACACPRRLRGPDCPSLAPAEAALWRQVDRVFGSNQ